MNPWSRTKKFLVVFLGILVVFVCFYCYRDKSAKLVQTDNVDQDANPKTGEIVDFVYAYNAAQDKAFAPAEDNGWRQILQALGPLALQQNELVDHVPWKEFPTNEKTKDWFNGEWTFICEKFKLDPHKRPKMLDRLWMWRYFAKNGLKGDEPIPTDNKNGTYCENFVERPAKVDEASVLAALTKPWTAEEYPVAARGIEENADLYDLYAKAARSPRFGCWRPIPEVSKGGFFATTFPDAQFDLEIVREFQVRANYRIGSGDLSGAIDDVESIMKIARALLSAEHARIPVRLVGLECIRIASEIPLTCASGVPPTTEQLSRIAELRASFYRGGQTEESIEAAFKGESRYFAYGAYVDYLKKRRKGLSKYELGPYIYRNPQLGPFARVFAWYFFNAPPVNDALSFQYFKNACAFQKHGDSVYDYLAGGSQLPEMLTSPPEKNNAIYAASIFFPPNSSVKDAFYRTDCVLKEGAIVTALLAYYQEHGTLPPAFTVDETGRPLHSWRVLILPYLGDSAKALYDKIRLDEPWNSPANVVFHTRIPEVYRCLSTKAAKEGETGYSVLLGDEGFFDASGVGKDFKEMAKLPGRDVWSQLLIVERRKPVCWMKPDEEPKITDYLAYGQLDPKKFFAIEDSRHTGGMNCACVGGDVHFYEESTTPERLDVIMRGTSAP